jgi:hypothetical protein
VDPCRKRTLGVHFFWPFRGLDIGAKHTVRADGGGDRGGGGERVRASILAIGTLVLVTVAGCSIRTPVPAPTLPTATQTPPSLAAVEPTLPPPATIGPASQEGFAIYLLAQGISPQQLAILSHLELEKQPLLSGSNIVAYSKATNEIELTASGYEHMHALSVPTSGKAFAVCVDGEPIYAGAFWVPISSQSFDGVVIDPQQATRQNPVIQIRLGYPTPAFFRGDDPRSDPRLLQALEQAGKLR